MNHPIRLSGRVLVAVVLLLAACSGPVFAQAVNSGEIRGTVTDPSGAVVPGVAVSILNTQTGVKTDVVSNDAGIYDALSILSGNYSLSFTKEGFTKLVRQGIDLRIQIITVNAQLAVGAASQTVEVSAQASLLKTESSETGSTLQDDVLQQLPHVGQNWTSFTQTLPGVTGSGTTISVNGGQHYEGGFYADGGNIVLPRSNNMDYLANFESIAQVEVITSNFNAQYGSGTAVFNQITKSGTNQFHGSLYEYNQNNYFNARSFFQKEIGRTRWNNYGGSIGGPVLKDKLFFYFNYDSTITRSASQGYATYPTQDMRNGDFSYPGFRNSDGTPRLIYDPNSLSNGVRTPYPGNKITGTLDPLAVKLQAFMPLPNTTPGTLDANYVPLPNQAGVITNNYYYTRINKGHPWSYMFKADYNFSGSNRLSMSAQRKMNNTVTDKTFNELWPLNINDSRNAALIGQVTDVWTISPTIVNEFRISMIRQSIRNVPASQGKGYIAQLGINYALGDVFPNVNIGGGGGAAGFGLNSGTRATMGDYTFAPANTITFIRGRHIIKAGGQYERNGDNGGNWGDLNPASWGFSPTFTSSAPGNGTSGLGYADFLTGQVSNWSAFLSPVVGIRMRAAQMFVQDDFKLRPNFTLNLGLRYEIQGGWGEVGNRLASFDATIKNSDGTLGAMWYAGDNGRGHLQKTVYNTFLPRIGFAWTPQPKWSLRGAFGMFSNRWGADTYAVSAVRNPTAFYTTGSDSVDAANATAPLFVLSNPNPLTVQPTTAGGKLFVPSSQTRTPSALNGLGVVYFPYETPATKTYEWSFGIQRELPQGIVAEVSYIGNKGTKLSFPRDLNQLPESQLGQGLAARPYPNFQSIGAMLNDGHSYYHGLTTVLRKRFSKGLSLDANYTWSRNLNNIDSGGHADTTLGGDRRYQRAYSPDLNYGISANDVTHMFKAVSSYELPVGKGKTLLPQGGPLDLIFGGWQVSGVFIMQSGGAFSPTVSGSNNSGQLYGGSWYPNRFTDGNLSSHSGFDPGGTQLWFDPSAFAVPAKNTFGNSGRNVLRGPGRTTLDMSMGKNFTFSRLREGMQLRISMDATNALNHPCWANPNSAIGSTSAGKITGTSVGGRYLQLGARLSF
jgi:hypothetical protein